MTHFPANCGRIPNDDTMFFYKTLLTIGYCRAGYGIMQGFFFRIRLTFFCLCFLLAGSACAQNGSDRTDSNGTMGFDIPPDAFFVYAYELRLFANFCGVPKYYAGGTHSIQIPQNQRHWFTFHHEPGRLPYVLTIQEASGQDIKFSYFRDCRYELDTGPEDSNATGQLEYFKFLNQAAYYLECRSACDQPFVATMPYGPL